MLRLEERALRKYLVPTEDLHGFAQACQPEWIFLYQPVDSIGGLRFDKPQAAGKSVTLPTERSGRSDGGGIRLQKSEVPWQILLADRGGVLLIVLKQNCEQGHRHLLAGYFQSMAAIMLLHAVSLLLGAAKLHDIDWDDLRHVLALARGGSFAAAGRALGTDATTVGRRLRILEKRLGTTLFARNTGGTLSPTSTGEIAVAKAEAMEAEVMALSSALDAADPMALGKVRLTAAPSFISRLLVPSLPSLLAQHSGLQLELIGDPRNLNLTRREADMALRLARPADMTNGKVVARRIATLDYAIYVATGKERHAEDLPWIIYEEAMAHLPHARWITTQAEKSGCSSPLAVNDAEALLQAAVAGLGRALLPKIMAENAGGLCRVESGDRNPPTREMWLLIHAELRQLVRIRAVSDWLDSVFKLHREQ